MTIEEMKNIDIRTVDPDTLVDIKTISIPEELEGEERVKEFLRQVKNPYCYRVGNIIVKNVFPENGPSIEECFQMLVRSI